MVSRSTPEVSAAHLIDGEPGKLVNHSRVLMKKIML